MVISRKNTERRHFTYTQTIHADPEKIFPLICPVKEAEWLDNWAYDLHFSESGSAEKGCTFSTSHNGRKNDTLWYISEYDSKNMRINFVYFIPNIRITDIQLIIKALDKSCSNVFIDYTHTSVSPEGDKNVAAMTEPDFIKHMKLWEDSVNHYLKTGTKLKV